MAHNLKGELIADTWCLAKKSEVTLWGKSRLTRRNDPRIARLSSALAGIGVQPDVIIFEDVQFSSYTLQCQMWASFRTVLWLTFPNAFFECVPVQTLKKFATGHGGATKEMMEASYLRQFNISKNSGLDDNAFDALWLYQWAQQKIKL